MRKECVIIGYWNTCEQKVSPVACSILSPHRRPLRQIAVCCLCNVKLVYRVGETLECSYPKLSMDVSKSAYNTLLLLADTAKAPVSQAWKIGILQSSKWPVNQCCTEGARFACGASAVKQMLLLLRVSGTTQCFFQACSLLGIEEIMLPGAYQWNGRLTRRLVLST